LVNCFLYNSAAPPKVLFGVETAKGNAVEW
jgi:hypothetical protein